jgi:uncharacterized repeat protein (TIGR01451 family)
VALALLAFLAASPAVADGRPSRAADKSGESVALDVFDLPPGGQVTLELEVTIDDPVLGGATSVSNQATLTGANFSAVASDDPDVGGAADPTTTLLLIVADLSVDKSDSADPVDAGAAFSYTLSTSNAGPAVATSVVLTDTLPAGVGFVSASGAGWSCGESLGVVTCTRPSYPVGTAPAVIISVTAPSEGGVITNTASIASNASDPVPGNDSDSEMTTVTAKADLSIDKSDSADPVDAGASFSYALAVANGGPSTATSVTVTDTLPAGVGFVSASGTGWSCGEALGVVTCTRPTLAVGAAPTITISVTAPAEGGVITNTASVDAAEDDPVPGNDSDSEMTTVTAKADLSIDKSDSADPVDAGAAFSYTLAVANGGPSTATSVTVTDTLPAGVGFVSASGTGWSCGEALGVVTCTRPTLAPGAAPTITISVTAPSEGGVITNTASVDAAEDDPVPGNDSDAEMTTVTAKADLSIDKSDSADPVDAGASFSYLLAVANGGPSAATSVTVSDTLPSGVGFVSASGTGWSCGEALGVVTCTRPSLAVGAAPVITISVTAPADGGVLMNTASVAAAEDDPVAGNDSDAESTTVTAQADLSIDKTDSADPVDAGASFSYTLAVANGGPSTATSVTVSDTLPPGVGFVSASGTGWSCGEALGVVTCTRPSLAPGAAPTITISVTAPAEGGAILNTASVDAAEDDPAAGNDSDTESTTVTAQADLSIDKSDSADPVAAAAGFSYTLAVANGGPSTATSVTVTDTLPAEVTFVSAGGTGWSCGEALGVVTCTRPSLAPGAAPPIAIAVTAPDESGTLSNTASVDAAEDDPVAADDSDVEMTSVTPAADLSIVKSDSADPVNAGASFSYTLAVANGGPSTATSVTVTDTLPAGVGFVSAGGTGWSCGEALGVVTCTRPSLALGAAPAITIAVTAPAAGGSILNTASVGGAEGDPVAANDSDAESTAVTAEADLSIDKSDSADPVNAGASFSYTLAVANGGPSTATAVTVTDTLPAGVGFVSASGTGWSCGEALGVVTCTRPSLAPGAAPAITIAVTAPAEAASLSNTASVDAAENDPAGGNDADLETTAVTAVAGLSIVKSDSADPVDVEAAFSYTLAVSNGGPSTATSVTVTDTLPAEVSFVSAGGTGWTCGEVLGVVTCTRPSLPVGAAPAITIAVTAPSEGTSLSNTASVDGAEDDPVAADDSDVETTEVQAAADLILDKTASSDVVMAGETLTYTVTVTNDGPSTATGVAVTDNLPAGVTFVATAGDCAEGAGGVPTCTLGSLAPGTSKQYTIEVTVDSPPPASIVNTASVEGTETDPDPDSNADPATVSTDLVPPVVAGVAAVPGDELADCDTAAERVVQLRVVFGEAMQASAGTPAAGDADSPESYLLVGTGPDLDFATVACGPPQGDDVAVAVSGVAYAADTPAAPQSTALLSFGGIPLADGLYRFFACGTLRDAGGNPLDGDADGSGGDDFAIGFRADAGNLFANGHFDCGRDGWDAVGGATLTHATDDADGSPRSGSVSFPAEGAMRGIEQCVELAGTASPYELSGRLRVVGVPAISSIHLLADCSFYAAPACADPPLGGGGLPPVLLPGGTGGHWQSFGGEIAAPAGTTSAQCDAVVSGPDGLSFEVFFDRLRLDDADEIFRDGFESGDPSAWSSSH